MGKLFPNSVRQKCDKENQDHLFWAREEFQSNYLELVTLQSLEVSYLQSLLLILNQNLWTFLNHNTLYVYVLLYYHLDYLSFLTISILKSCFGY